jgi:hypothetical protein
VLVCVLLDYKQISFELDGQAGILHEIKILPGGDLEDTVGELVAGQR